jgi:CRP/FNR family transcriptional regulator
LPYADVEPLLAAGIRLDLPAGSTLTARTRDEHRPVALVISGMQRIYCAGPDRKQVTVKYFRPGDVITGLAEACPVLRIQALSPTAIWQIPGETFRAWAQRDARHSWALAEYLFQERLEAAEELAGITFGTLRQRIARHLLDLAAADERSQLLVARRTALDLAQAVGSVRDVVSRVLREISEEGLIEQSPQGIVLLDSARLFEESSGAFG